MYPILDTRVECKFWKLLMSFTILFPIRIEPAWNVNDKWRDRPKNQYLIRIEPDWA